MSVILFLVVTFFSSLAYANEVEKGESPALVAVVVGTYHGSSFKTELPCRERDVDGAIDLLQLSLFLVTTEMEDDGVSGGYIEIALAGDYRGERFTMTVSGERDIAVTKIIERLKEKITLIRKKIIV